MKIAVVGVTGMVGRTFLKVLEERNFPVSQFIPVASERNAGNKIIFREKEHTIYNMQQAIEMQPDIALFSAGANVSLEFAPLFASKGTVVIDNSSAWRMDPDKKLIVPEINGNLLSEKDKIIANPNCSTIQMLLPLAPLHEKFRIKRIVVSTYQSISGTGMKAIRQLENERKGIKGDMAYPYPIDMNCIPQCDVFTDNGYTKEEMKLVNETKKILDPDIEVTATAVRIPVSGGHSESVNIEFHKEFEIEDIRKILSGTNGVIVMDNILENIYPMPIISYDKDEVFTGRIRRDFSQPKTLNLWIVADNLRKGAATNAIQIAEYIINSKLIKN